MTLDTDIDSLLDINRCDQRLLLLTSVHRSGNKGAGPRKDGDDEMNRGSSRRRRRKRNDRRSSIDGPLFDGRGGGCLVMDDRIDDAILSTFEELEDVYHFPISSNRQARAFIKALHVSRKLSYDTIATSIGESTRDVMSWQRGHANSFLTQLMLTRINLPLFQLLSEDDDYLYELENRKTRKLHERKRYSAIAASRDLRRRPRYNSAPSTDEPDSRDLVNTSYREGHDGPSRRLHASSKPRVRAVPPPCGQTKDYICNERTEVVNNKHKPLHKRVTPAEIRVTRGVNLPSPIEDSISFIDEDEEDEQGHVITKRGGDRHDNNAVPFHRNPPVSNFKENSFPVNNDIIYTTKMGYTAPEARYAPVKVAPPIDVIPVNHACPLAFVDELSRYPIPHTAPSAELETQPDVVEETTSVIQPIKVVAVLKKDDIDGNDNEKTKKKRNKKNQVKFRDEIEPAANGGTGGQTGVELPSLRHDNDRLADQLTAGRGDTDSRDQYEGTSDDDHNELDSGLHYDSDLDGDVHESSRQVISIRKMITKIKDDKEDGPGYLYIFSDHCDIMNNHRIKVGESRYPSKRLDQSKLSNINMKLVSAVSVSRRQQALQEFQVSLSKYAIKDHINWYRGSLSTILELMANITMSFPIRNSLMKHNGQDQQNHEESNA